MNHIQAAITRKLGAGAMALSVLLTALPAAAASEGNSNTLELRLQTGSTAAVVNGNAAIIAKPYTKNGTTMVPVGIFKKAFNSQVRLEQNDIVKIISGSHIVSMTIDSRTAWVNGHKIALTAAPEMTSGTLMVPLRAVADGLGAKLENTKAGMIIRMEAQEGETGVKPERPSIDNDEGKTQIGNSYYNWSMNYPSGLVVGEGGGDESISTFMDENNAYYLEIHVAEQPVSLDSDDLLQQLVQTAKDTGETIIDRKAFPQAKVPYARVITKDADGVLWENRQYYDHEHLYVVYFSDLSASNYKDLEKYAGLLNSFKTTYNPQDKTIKDLSTVEGGTREADNADYGISLKVPAGWKMDNSQMRYEDNDGSYLQLKVTSAPSGAKLEDWNKQMDSWLSDSFVSSAYQSIKTYPLVVSGSQGLVHEFRYNFGDGWVKEYDVMLQENGYRYLAEYVVPESVSKGQDQFQALMASMNIDFATVSSNFGQLDEGDYLTDKVKTIKKTSKAYAYTIDIPRSWTAVSDQFELGDIEYQFVGGEFTININKSKSFEMQVSQLKDFYDNEAKSYKNLKVEEVKDMTFAGVPAVSFTFHRVDNGIGYTGRQIVLDREGVTYTITTTLNDANNTTVQSAALDSALRSFSFVK